MYPYMDLDITSTSGLTKAKTNKQKQKKLLKNSSKSMHFY